MAFRGSCHQAGESGLLPYLPRFSSRQTFLDSNNNHLLSIRKFSFLMNCPLCLLGILKKDLSRYVDIQILNYLLQEMEDKLENESGFEGEFQTLKMLEDRCVFSTNEGIRPENANKNRYRNILPCKRTKIFVFILLTCRQVPTIIYDTRACHNSKTV